MKRSNPAFLLFVILIIGMRLPTPAWAQDASDLGGQWALNREASQFPKEIGFTADWLTGVTAGADTPAAGGTGGQRGTASGGAVSNRAAPRQSRDDAERVQRLTTEVRNPPARLTIADTPTAVTIAADGGPSRTFHPNGRVESVDLTSVVTAEVTTTREGGRLMVVYNVGQGRQLRYTYSRVASPAQVIVDVELIERGGGDKVRRIYDRATATPPSTATASSSAAQPGATSAAAQSPTQTLNQQPDAALKGLTKLGVVVEDLSPQAASCGLQHDAIETMVSKRLSDAGFTVLRYADEDTYIYVNVVTTSASNGLCFSRYDVDVNTNTTAKLSYGASPVLVQVTLLHKGGIAGGAAAAHGDSVRRGVQEFVDQFSARIRAANR
jgi:hypothetical protein